MQYYMKHFFFCAAVVLCLTACSEQKFKVDGTIANADNEVLYFEQMNANAPEVLDSVILKGDGAFNFKIAKSDYPDLYRLRLGNEAIIVAVDSTEHITIRGDKAGQFATQFEVDNSVATAQIAALRASIRNIQQEVEQLSNEELLAALEGHKQLAKDIVLTNTRSMAAYYAVYQTVNGVYLLSPYNKQELPFWSATATAFDLYYPEYYRSKQLKESTLGAIAAQRREQTANEVEFEAQETGLIDIALPNRAGDVVKLSSLIGDVVLVDFTSFTREESPAHIMLLRELYAIYHKKGFEIYQVSLYPNKLLWMEQSRELPWISVRDENSVYSPYVKSYNVGTFPALFLLNREGDIVARPTYEDLQKEIEGLL